MMKRTMTTKKRTIERLLEINLRINALLDSDSEIDDSLGKLLEEKNQIIGELQGYDGFPRGETWERIKELEARNLSLANNRKKLMANELSNIKTQSKTLAAYKLNNEQEPRIFDDSL